jgi:hypothetical protein
MVSLFILKSRVRGVFLFGFLSFFFLVKIQIVVGELCAMAYGFILADWLRWRGGCVLKIAV